MTTPTVHEFSIDALTTDTHFWVVLAFVFAFAIGFKFGRKAILDALDARSVSIREKIEEAERLRTEAQEMLTKYQHKYRDAMSEADEIIKQAQISANKAREKAMHDVKEKIFRMEEQAKKHLLEAQEQAIDDVRSFVADQAVNMAKEKLQKKLKDSDLKKLEATSIEKIANSIHQ